MNYQKFMELVPKETKDFVFTVLDRLNFYENASIFVKIKGLDGYYKKNFITGDEIKILSIMIKILNTTVYSSYSKGFLTRDIYYQNFNDIENELGNIEVFQFEKGSSEATLYKKYIDYFSFLDKEIDYLTLSPLRIFNRALTKIYNETKNIDFKESKKINEFYDILKKNGIDVTVRRKFGNKISAACGQLRSKEV